MMRNVVWLGVVGGLLFASSMARAQTSHTLGSYCHQTAADDPNGIVNAVDRCPGIAASTIGGAITAGFLVLGGAVAAFDVDHLSGTSKFLIILAAHAAAVGGGYLGYWASYQVDDPTALGWTLLATATVAFLATMIGLLFDLAEPAGQAAPPAAESVALAPPALRWSAARPDRCF